MKRRTFIKTAALSAAVAAAIATPQVVSAAGDPVISNIQIRGLNRVSKGAVLLALPVKEGDVMTPQNTALAMQQLYATGDFDDVKLSRDGDTFIVTVKERPTIGAVDFSGNNNIKKEDLEKIINQQGIRVGEALNTHLIESINGKNITSWKDVMYELVEVVGSTTPASVTVSSDLGTGQKRVLSLDASNIVLNRNESPIKKVGLEPCLGRIGTTLAMVEKGSPAQKASLKLGDEIAKINGIEMSSWYRIVDMIHDSNGAPLKLVVKRDGSLYQTTVVPENKYSEKTKMTVPYVGIAPEFKPIDGLRKTTRYGLVDALIKAVSDSASMAKLVLVSTYKLANGTISADNISGPIAIAQGAKESASFGFKIFISFLAAISVNLGILNLMPIPVLDGGQLLFLAYEAVMRKEPSARTQMILTSFGAAILLTMMIFAVFNDIKGF